MRVIQRGPAIVGDGMFRDFARSLEAADLAAATRRGYAADLGRFRAWIGVSVVLERKIAQGVSQVLLAACEGISGNTSHFTTFREPELRFAIRPQ